jgi:molecular chaperone GrpE
MKKEKPNPETSEEAKPAQPNEDKPVEETPKALTLEEKLIAAEAEIYNWKNKYALMFADMDNLRKNQDKAFADALRYRAEGFVEKLIPAMESFHIALKNPVDDPKLKNYLIGFEYIYNQLQQALDEEGLKKIPINLNDPFDVMTMHALDTEVSEGPPNRVLKILSPGFKLHDRVIKQTFVIVSKAKAEEKPVDTKEPANKDGNQAA